MAWVLTSNNFDVWLASDLSDISLTAFSDSSNYALITYVDTQDTTYDEPCIHDNVAAEFEGISGASEKVYPHDCDWFIIEDYEDSWNKKVLSFGNLIAGVSVSADDTNWDKFLAGTSWASLTAIFDYIDEEAIQCHVQAAEPATKYDGLLWFDTDDAGDADEHWVVIDQSTVTAVTGYAVTVGSQWEAIEIIIHWCEPATDNSDLTLAVGGSGGLIAGTNYYWNLFTIAGGSAGSYDSDAAVAYLNHPSYGVGNADSHEGYAGNMKITAWNDSNYHSGGFGFHVYHDSSTFLYAGYQTFHVRKAVQLTQFLIKWDSGNIDRGKFTVLGLRSG